MRPASWVLAIGAIACGAVAAACTAPDHAAADPDRCATCHMPEYLATKHPMHAGAKPTTCGVCHASDSWHPSRVAHPFFALTDGHAKAQCFDCHRGSPAVFRGTSKECVGCHRADFDRATFPGHAELPLTCEECHTRVAWKPSTWKTLPKPTPPATAAPSSEPHAPKPKTPPRPKPKPAPTGSTPDVITHPSRRK